MVRICKLGVFVDIDVTQDISLVCVLETFCFLHERKHHQTRLTPVCVKEKSGILQLLRFHASAWVELFDRQSFLKYRYLPKENQ